MKILQSEEKDGICRLKSKKSGLVDVKRPVVYIAPVWFAVVVAARCVIWPDGAATGDAAY